MARLINSSQVNSIQENYSNSMFTTQYCCRFCGKLATVKQELYNINCILHVQNCPKTVHQLMKECWLTDRTKRPPFKEIVRIIDEWIKYPEKLNEDYIKVRRYSISFQFLKFLVSKPDIVNPAAARQNKRQISLLCFSVISVWTHFSSVFLSRVVYIRVAISSLHAYLYICKG